MQTSHEFFSLSFSDQVPLKDPSSIDETQTTSKTEKKEPTRETEGPEECKKGEVKFEVYKYYVQSVGIGISLTVILFFALMQTTRTGSDWWLSHWTTSLSSLETDEIGEKDETYETRYYLQVFAGIALANSFFTMLRAFLFAYGGIRASLNIHKTLLKSTLTSTLSFFDTTSFGRIINRFSSDITDVDDRLPFNLNIFLAQIFSLAASLIITIYGIPVTSIMIVILAIPYYFIQVELNALDFPA